MAVGEEQSPPMPTSSSNQPIDLLPTGDVKRKVIEPRPHPIMPTGSHRRGLLDHEIGPAKEPGAAVLPSLEGLPAQLAQQPAKTPSSGGQISHPQLDVVQPSSIGHLGTVAAATDTLAYQDGET